MYGKKKMGIVRSTFLIGPDGIIEKVWRSVKVDGHDAAVIEALQELQTSGARSDDRMRQCPPPQI